MTVDDSDRSRSTKHQQVVAIMTAKGSIDAATYHIRLRMSTAIRTLPVVYNELGDLIPKRDPSGAHLMHGSLTLSSPPNGTSIGSVVLQGLLITDRHMGRHTHTDHAIHLQQQAASMHRMRCGLTNGTLKSHSTTR